MDIKPYIDYFPEINGLDKQRQFQLLEQARDCAFTPFSLAFFNILSVLVPMLFVLSLGGAFYSTIGYFTGMPLVALVAGMISARVVVSHLRKQLLLKGLMMTLKEHGEPITL